MRVFLAGASGAIGSRLVPLLVSAGHSVTGLTRTPEKAEAIRQVGGDAVVADGLDESAVRAAVMAAKPEVVLHQMTSLAGMSDLRQFDRTFAVSNRLRTEGLDHLLAAATAAGSRRFIAQSFCGWPYARTGGTVKSEEDALDPGPPAEMQRTLEAIRYLEKTTISSKEIEGVVLRYGAFYGPGTGMLEASIVSEIRRRRFPLIGNGNGWWSFLHIDDAAAATALAVERGEPGIYNIVDDEPAPVREWLPALAAMLGAKQPFCLPKWLARIVAGEHLAMMMTEARAGSNAKAKRDLAWQPAYPSWRQGFAAALAAGT